MGKQTISIVFKSALKVFGLAAFLLLPLTGCEFFEAIFRGLGEAASGPRVAYEVRSTPLSGDIPSTGAVKVLSLTENDTGLVIGNKSTSTIVGNPGEVTQLKLSESGEFVAGTIEEYIDLSSFLFENIIFVLNIDEGMQLEAAESDNTLLSKISPFCTLSEGEIYDTESFNNFVTLQQWLSDRELLLQLNVEVLREFGPDSNIVYWVRYSRDSAGEWEVTDCSESEPATLPDEPVQIRDVSVMDGILYLDGEVLNDISDRGPVERGVVTTVSGPF